MFFIFAGMRKVFFYPCVNVELCWCGWGSMLEMLKNWYVGVYLALDSFSAIWVFIAGRLMSNKRHRF